VQIKELEWEWERKRAAEDKLRDEKELGRLQVRHAPIPLFLRALLHPQLGSLYD